MARKYTDACTTRGGLAAPAFVRDGQDEIPVLLGGQADVNPTRSLLRANAICGLGMFAMAAAVVSLGEQLTGKRMISLVANNAAAGPLIKAYFRVPAALDLIDSFRGAAARLSAS